VVTKVDKLSRNDRARQVRTIAAHLACAPESLVRFSAASGEGRDELWAVLEGLLGERETDALGRIRGEGSR